MPKAGAPQDQPPIVDDSYATENNESVPVLKDDAPIEDPIDETTADTDAQLGEALHHPRISRIDTELTKCRA
jgi:hypothetical protein